MKVASRNALFCAILLVVICRPVSAAGPSIGGVSLDDKYLYSSTCFWPIYIGIQAAKSDSHLKELIEGHQGPRAKRPNLKESQKGLERIYEIYLKAGERIAEIQMNTGLAYEERMGKIADIQMEAYVAAIVEDSGLSKLCTRSVDGHWQACHRLSSDTERKTCTDQAELSLAISVKRRFQ